MDDQTTPRPRPAEELERIRALLRQREFAAALAASATVLAADPEQRDALLFTAIAQRFLGQVGEAQQTLARLALRHPSYSRLHEELGHCYVAQKQAPQAIESFLQAVHVNHALPASWTMLEGLCRMVGRLDEAATAGNQAATLKELPREVVVATALFMDGDLDDAETTVRSFLQQHGHDLEAMRLLARIGMARKVFDDAELLLSAVLEIAPDYKAARAEYAEVLIEMHKCSQALRELDRLQREDPEGRLRYEGLRATALVGLGEHARAVEVYQALIRLTPQDPDLHLSVAHALKTLGRRDEAIAEYRQAEAARHGFGDAYWSLANLKTYRFTDQEFERLRALQTAPGLAVADRYHLHFALAKALEDRQQYAEAFHYYELGNALRRAHSNYRPEIIENNTRQQIEVCTVQFFASRGGYGTPERDPIFIVGLPRSGSTLIEQILASHSQVEGTQELPNVQQLVANLRGREPDLHNPRYPRILPEMSAAEFRSLGEQYLQDTRPYRVGKPDPVPFFIDKMPNNFRHLGLIRLILPNAKIIDARREPLACCFSNLKQLFAKGQEFTYSIEDIARYYRTYLELMRHWDALLPGWILRVQHEDVVDDLQGSVRRLLGFCELEFEPQCVDFHKTVRSVRTASSEQVRQPIYREGLDQWKHFEPWLQPLKQALGDALVGYRDH